VEANSVFVEDGCLLEARPRDDVSGGVGLARSKVRQVAPREVDRQYCLGALAASVYVGHAEPRWRAGVCRSSAHAAQVDDQRRIDALLERSMAREAPPLQCGGDVLDPSALREWLYGRGVQVDLDLKQHQVMTNPSNARASPVAKASLRVGTRGSVWRTIRGDWPFHGRRSCCTCRLGLGCMQCRAHKRTDKTF